jgi:hypothetical protein
MMPTAHHIFSIKIPWTPIRQAGTRCRPGLIDGPPHSTRPHPKPLLGEMPVESKCFADGEPPHDLEAAAIDQAQTAAVGIAQHRNRDPMIIIISDHNNQGQTTIFPASYQTPIFPPCRQHVYKRSFEFLFLMPSTQSRVKSKTGSKSARHYPTSDRSAYLRRVPRGNHAAQRMPGSASRRSCIGIGVAVQKDIRIEEVLNAHSLPRGRSDNLPGSAGTRPAVRRWAGE